MPIAGKEAANPLVLVGDAVQKLMAALGDLSTFSWHALHFMRLCLAWLNLAYGNQEAGTFVGSKAGRPEL